MPPKPQFSRGGGSVGSSFVRESFNTDIMPALKSNDYVAESGKIGILSHVNTASSNKYSVIYADPPWLYRDKAQSGRRGAEFKYPCMPVEDIKTLPVSSLATADCALFLWVTFPLLGEGLELIRAWGFEYKTVAFTWIKTTKNGKLFLGMGNWTRSNAEICLLGLKGRPDRISASVHSVIMSPVREHSRKPDEVRERIVQLMGDVPRIELFARERIPGWDCFGNEVESDVVL